MKETQKVLIVSPRVITATRIAKLPKWVQNVIGSQQRKTEQMQNEYADLIKQRDALVAACVKLLKCAERLGGVGVPMAVLYQARAALALVKGGTSE